MSLTHVRKNLRELSGPLEADPAASQGKPGSVDQDKGVIFGVKVLGVHSLNGRIYTREAIAKAVALYKNAKIRVNHPAKPGDPYKTESTIGWLEDLRLDAKGELRGNFHYFKEHEMAPLLVEAAIRNPSVFGLSHNILSDTTTDAKGVVTIHEILEVLSVDLVGDPATTKGLFESRSMKKNAKKFLAEKTLPLVQKLPAKKRKLIEGKLKKLIEDMDPATDLDMEDDDEKGDHRDHLFAAYKACEDDDTKAKILAMLKPAKKKDDETEDDDADANQNGDDAMEDVDDTDDDGDQAPDKPGKKEREGKKEGRELRRKVAALEAENAVHRLCETLDFRPSAVQRKALLSLPTEADRKALIAESKGGSGKGGKGPRSSGSGDAPITESRILPTFSNDDEGRAKRAQYLRSVR